jgi:hypothetical protein
MSNHNLSPQSPTQDFQPAIENPQPPVPSLSPQKLLANRLNAMKSTGPRTPEGKARVAINAQTHGLRSQLSPQSLVPQTDHDAYAAFAQDLREHLDPQSPLEEMLLERITLLGYKLRRHAQAEARLLDQANRRARENVERANRHARQKYEDQLAHHQRYNKKDPPPPPTFEPIPEPEPAAHLLARFAQNPADARPLELLSRYETATERAFYKALGQYRDLRSPDLQLESPADTDQHHHFHYHHHTDNQDSALRTQDSPPLPPTQTATDFQTNPPLPP